MREAAGGGGSIRVAPEVLRGLEHTLHGYLGRADEILAETEGRSHVVVDDHEVQPSLDGFNKTWQDAMRGVREAGGKLAGGVGAAATLYEKNDHDLASLFQPAWPDTPGSHEPSYMDPPWELDVAGVPIHAESDDPAIDTGVPQTGLGAPETGPGAPAPEELSQYGGSLSDGDVRDPLAVDPDQGGLADLLGPDGSASDNGGSEGSGR